jgi:hypothetical protein
MQFANRAASNWRLVAALWTVSSPQRKKCSKPMVAVARRHETDGSARSFGRFYAKSVRKGPSSGVSRAT